MVGALSACLLHNDAVAAGAALLRGSGPSFTGHLRHVFYLPCALNVNEAQVCVANSLGQRLNIGRSYLAFATEPVKEICVLAQSARKALAQTTQE